MGLDMYLYAVPKIEGMELKDILSANVRLWRLQNENPDFYLKMKEYVKPFEEYGTQTGILTEIMYWRKANQIHRWFVENLQDGIDDNGALSEVNRNQIISLSNICKTILMEKSRSIDLLPTMAGCFFGSVDYDRIYYHEIQRTVNKLEDIIHSPYIEKSYILYQSSW